MRALGLFVEAAYRPRWAYRRPLIDAGLRAGLSGGGLTALIDMAYHTAYRASRLSIRAYGGAYRCGLPIRLTPWLRSPAYRDPAYARRAYR